MQTINLLKKLNYFDLIIFDLDDTLISLRKYDKLLFQKICDDLIQKKKTKKILLKKLVRLRQIEINRFKSLKIFDKFFNKKNRKLAIKIYNSYFPNLFKIEKKNLNILKILKKKNKELYLVTNGNINRQSNKIENLKISKYFKRLFILDGKKKKFKPSVSSLNILKKKIRYKKAVMIGDSKIDQKFAKNLKVQYIKYSTL